MNAIQHQVNQTKDLPLLQARPPERKPTRQHAVVSKAVRHYGPLVEKLRGDGLTYEQIGRKLEIAPKSASAFLSRYRTGARKGKI